VILGFIDASQLRLGSQRFQQEIGQGLDQSLFVSLHGCCRNLTIQIENELRPTVVPLFFARSTSFVFERWDSAPSLPIRTERRENAGELVETLDADLGWTERVMPKQ
jgi:hypothetical protein